MTDCLETSVNLPKPAEEVYSRFPTGFWQIDKITGNFSPFSFYTFTVKSTTGITSDFVNLPETCQKPPRQVSGG